MSSALVGERDFSCFAAEGDNNHSKVRRVTLSAFHMQSDTLVYTIAATSFLWKMVRTIIGTFLMLEEQGLGADELRRILESRYRGNAGGTAPAKGLFLERVLYDEEEAFSPNPVAGAEHGGGLPGVGILPPPP
jgi:tRNA pseudouridine38-40 synthase